MIFDSDIVKSVKCYSRYSEESEWVWLMNNAGALGLDWERRYDVDSNQHGPYNVYRIYYFRELDIATQFQLTFG